MLHQFVAQELLEMSSNSLQSGCAIHDVSGKMEPVEVIQHRHVKWSSGCSLFLVATDVQIVVTGSPISQSVNQPGVAVVGEDDGPVCAENRIEITIRETVWVLAGRLKCHQVHDIDDPNF